MCHNLPGSYFYTFQEEYITSGGKCIGKTVHIKVCRFGNGGCEQMCHNLQGSYFCTCQERYITSGGKCKWKTVYFSECILGNGGCDQMCHNLPGSYFGACQEGYITSVGKCNGKTVYFSECILVMVGVSRCATIYQALTSVRVRRDISLQVANVDSVLFLFQILRFQHFGC